MSPASRVQPGRRPVWNRTPNRGRADANPARPLTVLFVIHNLNRGGAETSLLLLCRHLDRRRFTPVVCCLDDRGALAPAFEADGVEVLALDRKPGIQVATLRPLAALMRSRRPDIVDAQGWPASFWGRLAALVTGIRPLVVTEHGDVEPRPLRHTLADALLGVFTARVVAKSGEIARLYRRRVRIPARKVEVVPNGVECDALACAFDPIRARSLLGVPGDVPTVGIVGRLHAVKGHDLFLAAVALLRVEEPGLLALVVGDGPERAALAARASALGISDCLRMVGERSDVPEIIGAIDVLMLTSRSEGCPMAALEAMAVGVPLVAPRIAPFEEISGDGEAAVLVPAGDAPAFAAASLALLRDRRRRAALAEAARRRVRGHHDINQKAARLELLYQRAVQPRGLAAAVVEAGRRGR